MSDNNIGGYYYMNSTNKDKYIKIYFKFDDTNTYIIPFIFPKLKVSYVFFYNNKQDSNNLWISVKPATSLAEAMNQPNFESRKMLNSVIIHDSDLKSIHFSTNENNDKNFSLELYTKDKITNNIRDIELIVKKDMINGHAGRSMAGWIIHENTPITFPDPGIDELANTSSKIATYFNNNKNKNGFKVAHNTKTYPYVINSPIEVTTYKTLKCVN